MSDSEWSGLDLLEALSSLTDGSKLGTALKVVSAFSKVEQLIADIKNLAPDVYQALAASIVDIISIMGDIIDQIGQAIDPTSKSSECTAVKGTAVDVLVFFVSVT